MENADGLQPLELPIVTPQPAHAPRANITLVDSRASKLLEEALKLPPKARAALAGSLLQSLHTDLDEGAAEAWEEEIAERLKRLDSGSETLSPWDEVRRRLRGRG